MQNLFKTTDDLLEALAPLEFSHPVTHIYNPLKYARSAYDEYLKRYGGKPKEVLLLGMNPGPWGMVQTGIPFGEISAVRDWMGIPPHHGVPGRLHPKRPVEGFCAKGVKSVESGSGAGLKRRSVRLKTFSTVFLWPITAP